MELMTTTVRNCVLITGGVAKQLVPGQWTKPVGVREEGLPLDRRNEVARDMQYLP